MICLYSQTLYILLPLQRVQLNGHGAHVPYINKLLLTMSHLK